MDYSYYSYISLLIFVLTTVIYYFLKPSLKVDTINDETKFSSYKKTQYIYMVAYFFLIVILQFGINSAMIITKCGGDVGSNIGVSGLITFIPWILIFGIVIVSLILFPGFKSAFSNVVGYFWVASNANTILTKLLIHTDINKAIEEEKNSQEKKKELQSAADTILKLCGNMSILINQIVPDNFEEYWNILHPLMKPEYQKNTPDTDTLLLKQNLLDVVVRRDNVGEALWYIYTAILLISITQYNIMSKGCVKDMAAMKASQQEYAQKAQEMAAKTEKAQSTIYTIKN